MKHPKLYLLLLVIACLLVSGCDNKQQTFLLEEKYYNNNTINEIESQQFEQLVTEKESFAIFIYQSYCAASESFEKVLTEFTKTYQISLYKMSFSTMKETNLGKKIKYYPSLVIYQDGKLIDYLDANSKRDSDYYKSVDNFTNWFTSYVEINQNENSNEDNSSSNNENQSTEKIDTKLEDIKYNKDKVNVYLFWGDGCPNCEAEHQFFKEIKQELGDYYILNSFEVWYNEDNQDLLKQFSTKMGDEVSLIPYTIIGNKTFIGFGEKTKNQIKSAIKEQYKNSYDVYFNNK